MGDGGTVELNEGGSIADLDRLADPRGRRIAAVLAGAWRSTPPSLEMSAQALDEIALGLVRLKTGALGWWRVRHSALRTSPAADRLRDMYHLHAFQAALHSRDLSRIVTRLRDAGVEPVLVKGPAIARLYPERGLRPFGDLDLCVRPDQHQTAAAVVDQWVRQFSPVDLHAGFAELRARSWDDVYDRSQVATFGGIDVRVLAPEDHLRFLCLHLLRHGIHTPLWLCDVAVAVESRPQNFDWDLALGPNRRRADWVACTIGLAHRLFGMRVDDTPVAARARRLPQWLVASVLERWGRECPVDYQPPELVPNTWRLLAHVPQSFRLYWPSPVAATVHLYRPFSNFPRMPIQIVDAVARMTRYSVRRLMGRRPRDLDLD